MLAAISCGTEIMSSPAAHQSVEQTPTKMNPRPLAERKSLAPYIIDSSQMGQIPPKGIAMAQKASVTYCCCRPSQHYVEDEDNATELPRPSAEAAAGGTTPGCGGGGGSGGSGGGGGGLGGAAGAGADIAAGAEGGGEKEMQDEPPEPIEGEPARLFPFKLDPFQDYAIRCLHKEESVMVSAHTSAGKTVVAQYAIAMAIQRNQRVIYTTPIKALSNQKYRDLKEAFEEHGEGAIGLMTGDVTANPEASCIVMTTEILRSMLYHGSSELREVSWVVFDEVHYLRDKERGVVWEESIVLLPPSIKLAFLSATIPNAREFAQWISDLKRLPCHVITTDFRPTPLQHYMFPAGGDGIYLCVDERGAFLKDNFDKMLRSLDGDVGEASGGGGKRKRPAGGSPTSDIQKVIGCVVDQRLAPAIVFSFSRRECEALAVQLCRSKVELVGDEDKASIREVYDNALGCLSDSDQQLPQIKLFLPLLTAGIGVHHSGILPILRELVELLFQEGLIKVLFATETFALGLNMPAKTVIFSNCRKFDGTDQRWISSGEYIQMAGRAGRRGLDERGVAITMFDQRLEPDVAQAIICGEASHLSSTFHLGYNILLNVTRTTGIEIEGIISKSFHQFQNSRKAPGVAAALRRAKAELRALPPPPSDEAGLKDFLALEQLRSRLEIECAAEARLPGLCLPFMCPGRVVRVKGGGLDGDWGWGAVVGFQCRTRPGPGQQKLPPRSSIDRYVIDVLMAVRGGADGDPIAPCSWRGWVGEGNELVSSGGKAGVIPVPLSSIETISALRVYLSSDLSSSQVQADVLTSVYKAVSSFEVGSMPLLDAVRDMGSENEEIVQGGVRLRDIKTRMEASDLAGDYRDVLAFETRLEARRGEVEGKGGEGLVDGVERAEEELGERAKAIYVCRRRILLEREQLELEGKMKISRLHSFKDELRGRMKVLRRMQYVNDDGVVTLKGRCACEIEIAQDLVAVEMMLSGAFNNAPPEDIAAILSCLIVEEKDTGCGHVQEVLLKDMVLKIGEARTAMCKAEAEAGLTDLGVASPDPDTVNTSLMDTIHAWCKGAEFADVCEGSNLFEGSIIRAMRREAELIRQMVKGAAAIGDTELEERFQGTLEKLERGLPFSASLYL